MSETAAQVIKKEYIFTGMEFADKEECLKAIAQKAVELGICEDEEKTYRGFLEREAEGPTGMEDGFAIPHTRSAAVIRSGIIVMKAREAVEWESFDGQPVNMMIALIVPEENKGTEHIRLLAGLSRMLVKKEFRSRLKQSESADEILEVIRQAVQ